MNKKIVFIIMGLFISVVATAEPVCNRVCQRYGTCKTCVETCNRCQKAILQDPEFPINAMTLPVNFSYSRVDDIKNNDTCQSSGCGTKNCNAGVTEYKNDALPAKDGFCELTPNDRIPAKLNCTYQDGFCQVYCSKTHTYSCCKSYTTVCS